MSPNITQRVPPCRITLVVTIRNVPDIAGHLSVGQNYSPLGNHHSSEWTHYTHQYMFKIFIYFTAPGLSQAQDLVLIFFFFLSCNVGTLSCSMRSSSLTRIKLGPSHRECRVLASGPPRGPTHINISVMN